MSKIVCDICGTEYPETELECPICGCTKESSAALLADTVLAEELTAAAAVLEEQVPAPVVRQNAPVVDDDEDYDYDEDDDEDEDDEDDDDDEDEDDDDDEPKSNALLVVLLVIVILALLAVSAFILVKYVAPNVFGPKETAPATTVATEAPAETTELTIPCENLALTSGGEIVLDAEGANWLINVLALPENTTDTLVYTSSDESVATVNEQGKITAVGEGTAVITITCGEQELKCTVTVNFTPETTVPEETTEPTDETVPEETTEPTEPEEETVPPETEAFKPYTAIITAGILNIRENPDSNSASVGVYGKGHEVTILEEKQVGNTLWGRTDMGWISLDYVKRN